MRLKAAFLKLDAKSKAEFASWTVPWLPVDKQLVVSDEHHRIQIIMEPRRPIGRRRGWRMVPDKEFVAEWTKVTEDFLKLKGRRPKHREIAYAMGHEWWNAIRREPTASYWRYVDRNELKKT
jgi:hypothetical protein